MTADPGSVSAGATGFPYYLPARGTWDEWLTTTGEVRPQCSPVARRLELLGASGLRSRSAAIQRLLPRREPPHPLAAGARPRRLDPVPLVLSASEWSHLEAGLRQRARLFELILDDLYRGTQRLLREGLIPADLVHANSGYRRACRGLRASVRLHLHACTLARGADGTWRVLADATQFPGALACPWENRAVMARAFGDDFRRANVREVATFHERHAAFLAELAPEGSSRSDMILLAPGSQGPNLASFARRLGIRTAEPRDLTVRGRALYLKCMGGLRPVHFVLRFCEDRSLDPLETCDDSPDGVPGLLECARAGNVVIANAPGTAVLEAAAWAVFLPAICRRLLGEELMLPAAPAWWCGEPAGLRHVLDHLGALTVLPAFGAEAGPRNGAPSPDPRKLDRLADAIRASPRSFVARQREGFSTAPVWVDGRLEPRAVLLQTFTAQGPHDAAVLPGGIAVIASSHGEISAPLDRESDQKDTWIIAAHPLPPGMTGDSGDPASPCPQVPRELLSRAAENQFWLGRYLERLDGLLRVLRSAALQVPDDPHPESTPFAELLRQLCLLPPQLPPGTSLPRELARILSGPAGCLEDLTRCCLEASKAQIGELPPRIWRILQRLREVIPDEASLPGIDALALKLAALRGCLADSMDSGPARHLLEIGSRLERVMHTISLLAAIPSVNDRPHLLLEPLLEITESTSAFPRDVIGPPRLPAIFDLLVRDETNPRSLASQIPRIIDHIEELGTPRTSPEVRRLSGIQCEVAGIPQPPPHARVLMGGTRVWLERLQRWRQGFAAVSDELSARWFHHLPSPAGPPEFP